MTIVWPRGVLRPQNPAFDIAPRSLRGPASVSGISQVVSADAGIWKVRFGNVLVRNRDQVLSFRAIGAILEGRLNPIVVPLCSAYQPLPEHTEADTLPLPHDDETFFSDNSGYAQGLVNVTWAATVSPVSAVIDTHRGGLIQPGHHFSVGERLYRLTSVGYNSAATVASITFRPPLREAVTAGAHVEFDNPVCRVRLATDNEMDLDLQLNRFANPTVNFIEDL